ncbi:MAG: peptidoglycan DD-metalloendopeptidase family protein [Allosphingosinicella sp.]
MSGQVIGSRSRPHCSNTNAMLATAVEREPHSPAAPLYRCWIGDNLARDGRFAEAVAAYDSAVAGADSAARLSEHIDPVATALGDKAKAAVLAGDAETAIAAYGDLAALPAQGAYANFHAGLVAEGLDESRRAADLYRKAAAERPSRRADDPAELARRALLRLESPASAFTADARPLADRLAAALAGRDQPSLQQLVSKTHFAAGLAGGHALFEDEDLLDALYLDLAESRVTVRRSLLGSGNKLYLQTRGWRGRWYRGEVLFMLTRAPRGWQWTGVAVTLATEPWLDRWQPPVAATNQPLPFELLAPWPAGDCFMAGGIADFVAGSAIAAAAWPFSFVVLETLSLRSCGFGFRGLYYGHLTHTGLNHFAIDFSRYRRGVPQLNASGGTHVLAVHEGIVTTARGLVPSGNQTDVNFVEVDHADPADPANPSKFRSRYLHLEGPAKLFVSLGMHVRGGTQLGRMDDTGDSIIDHLHFSIHDLATGASIRPTPMAGSILDDEASGTCVCSRTQERFGDVPMIEVTEFAGQNWVITPAARAVNETAPARIQDQKWLLCLSGVAMVGLTGQTSSDWTRTTVSIWPDLHAPMQHAIAKHGIPAPQGAALWFQVEQWAPFASLGSIFNQNQSINSGFAVDVWRPNPFHSDTDAVTNAPLNNLFRGFQADVAVRDNDAHLYRVGYNILLLGKIVFAKIVT